MTQFEEQFLRDKGVEFTPELVGEYSYYLTKYCSKYFLEWWNPEKFKWNDSEYLVLHCSKYTQWKIDGYKLGKIRIEKFSPDEIVKLRLDNLF